MNISIINSVPITTNNERDPVISKHWRSYEIVFYALFVCRHYFVQYGFIQVCIFYLFFWKTSFLSSSAFCVFLPFLCRIQCNLHILSIICAIIVYIVGVRNSMFCSHLLEANCKSRYRITKVWLQLLKVESCKLYNNKYMFALTQIINTEIFAFLAVLSFEP